MSEMSLNHFQIVEQSLNGKRAVDEQTFGSVAILSERLERLKRVDKNFGDIRFSSAVQRLIKQKDAVAVG